MTATHGNPALNTPGECPRCHGPYADIEWCGGTPPYGPDHWLCHLCGHQWDTTAAPYAPQ